MNAGLGNLTTLKTQLLAEALRDRTEYDAALTAIGLGVAGQFDRFCNRGLARAENDTVIFPANNPFYFLPRYPVEEVSKVEQKDDETNGFYEVTDALWNSNPANGQVYFGAALGPDFSALKITFTGGYWFDTTEDATGTLPAGATALPGDLKLAWLMQCEEIWNQKDKLGMGIVSDNAKKPTLKMLELIPEVKEILSRYIRFNMA